MNENSATERLDWEQVSAFTPMLFLHDHQADPPLIAKRLWTAIHEADLDVYDCPIAQSLVKARLMTLALIQQEFRVLVWRQGSMIQPLDILGFLEVPIDQIAALTGQRDADPLAAALLVDAANRRQLSPVVASYFADIDSLFRALAFPEGLSDADSASSLDQLLATSPDQAVANDLVGQFAEPPNPTAGVAFIESGFTRSMQYAA